MCSSFLLFVQDNFQYQLLHRAYTSRYASKEFWHILWTVIESVFDFENLSSYAEQNVVHLLDDGVLGAFFLVLQKSSQDNFVSD